MSNADDLLKSVSYSKNLVLRNADNLRTDIQKSGHNIYKVIEDNGAVKQVRKLEAVKLIGDLLSAGWEVIT